MIYKNNLTFICTIMCLVIVSNAYKFINLRNDTSMCIIRPLSNTHTTIILDLVDDDLTLTKCYQPEVFSTFITFKGDQAPYNITRKTFELFLHDRPNIIIITDLITDKIINNFIFEITLQYQWSLMHLIITNTNINCEQAELNGDILPIAKRLLNDLWHRYQLVYALIEFPLACPRRFITFDGNKRPNDNLYNRTITVIEKEDLDETLKKSQNTLSDGFPLKINLFHRFPTSFKQCHKIYNYMKFDINITNGFCGMDALIMHDFIKKFKFNVTYVDNNRTNKYGYVVSGHATGSLGAVIRREIDISFNSRFMAMYMNSGFDFLSYVSSDSLCALTMIPDIVPLWQYPINMYNYKQWMAVTLILMTIGLVTWLFNNCFRNIIREKLYKLNVYIIETLWTGMFGFFLMKRFQRSFLIAICLLWSIVFSAKYQGHINYMFTTLRRYDQFRTLQDICDSNIAVYTSPGILMLLNAETVDNSTNDVFTTILKRLKLFSANSSYTVEEKNMAMIRRRIDITLEILVNHTDKDGRPSLYVINDCFRNFYLSYIVRSGFLFTSQIQNFMMRMVEAGFPEKYYKWTSFTLRLGDILHNPTSEPRLFTKITLKELRIPFVILISGYIVSTITFMVEKWWSSHKMNIMQNESSQF